MPGPSPATPPTASDAADETPDLERTAVFEGFSDHVTAVFPRWLAVTDLLAQSDQPELREVSGAVASQLRAAQVDQWPALDVQDLIAEERQLVNFLRQRYRGFEPLEEQLRVIDAEVGRLDGG